MTAPAPANDQGAKKAPEKDDEEDDDEDEDKKKPGAKTSAPAAAPAKGADQGPPKAADKAPANDDEAGNDDEDDKQFRQPVRVGDLIGRAVIAPLESQDVIGHVKKIVANGDGDATVVMTRGGYFGFGTSLVCVSAADLALTGHAIQAKDVSPEDIDGLPVCDGAGDKPLDPNASIKMNLAKPAH